ncbi:unnamed protein product [Brugia pahangi]|uniref:Uncharacterized protein n=1 Tax=Brugia pahangi TaxID=6280 RepID=A0A0N4TAQ4_BRUPA|nr:unnamed protein product [Brugia pahangi]
MRNRDTTIMEKDQQCVEKRRNPEYMPTCAMCASGGHKDSVNCLIWIFPSS